MTLPHLPFDPGAPDLAADVPVLIGTTETEGTYNAADLVEMDDAAMRTRLAAPDVLGSDAGRILEIFRRRRPHATPAELYFTIRAMPMLAIRQAELKAAQGGAPAFLWQINWRTPVRDGLFLSPHCVELPFVFDNVWHAPEMVGTGPEIQPLARQDERGLGGVCAHRQSEPRRNPALAACTTLAAVPRW